MIVTPAMHRVHHHYRMPFLRHQLRQYLSVWDHVFCTYREEDNDKLRYGLDTHMELREANILELVEDSFQKYRGIFGMMRSDKPRFFSACPGLKPY
ncbi:MAG: hypothetical protein R3B47_11190 [Bacteroidia bacterium]